MKRSVLALLSVFPLLACLCGGEQRPDPNSCSSVAANTSLPIDGSFQMGEVQNGTFQPWVPTQDVRLVSGGQGGCHVFVVASVPAEFVPGDQEACVQATIDGSQVRVALDPPAGGTRLSRQMFYFASCVDAEINISVELRSQTRALTSSIRVRATSLPQPFNDASSNG